MSELNVASVNSDLCKISQFMKKKQVIVQRKMGCLSDLSAQQWIIVLKR